MPTDTRSMHRIFLDEIREAIRQAEAQLAELRSVARYHESKLDEASGMESPASQRVTALIQDGIGDQLGGDTRRHDAAAIALSALGGRAKTPDIVRWLRERGYGNQQDLKIFQAAVFTALSRHSEMFERVANERGMWQLANTSSHHTREKGEENGKTQ